MNEERAERAKRLTALKELLHGNGEPPSAGDVLKSHSEYAAFEDGVTVDNQDIVFTKDNVAPVLGDDKDLLSLKRKACSLLNSPK